MPITTSPYIRNHPHLGVFCVYLECEVDGVTLTRKNCVKDPGWRRPDATLIYPVSYRPFWLLLYGLFLTVVQLIACCSMIPISCFWNLKHNRSILWSKPWKVPTILARNLDLIVTHCSNTTEGSFGFRRGRFSPSICHRKGCISFCRCRSRWHA